MFLSTFFLKLHNQEPENSPDRIVFDIRALLRLLAKVFFVLAACPVVRNNS